MGGSFTKLFDAWFKNREMRVVMLGLDAAVGARSCGGQRLMRSFPCAGSSSGLPALQHSGQSPNGAAAVR
jgi:hypothetical protein